jgi:UDPglucose 6-dehydrogenase
LRDDRGTRIALTRAHGPTIAVVGTGYVGLATAVLFSELGHRVIGIDRVRARVEMLTRGEAPIVEPGMDALLQRGLASGRLAFTTEYDAGLRDAEYVFLCVGTPSLPGGEADTSQVRAAARSIAAALPAGRPVVVVNKSTTPIGGAEMIEEILVRRLGARSGVEVVVNPEFLREGRVIEDVFHPTRVVIGSERHESADRVAGLFRSLGAPIVMTDRRSAEMVKYAANAFLATKISFMNEIAQLCEHLDADVMAVSAGLALDPRIGPDHLRPGIGFGGACLPKDLDALRQMSDAAGAPVRMLHAAADVNHDARRRFVERLERYAGGLEGRTVGVLGLAFKEGTADFRSSPALEVIGHIQARGAAVRAFDPMATRLSDGIEASVEIAEDAYEAARGADALCILTAWPAFLELDFGRVAAEMRGDLVLDGRNALDPERVRSAGLRYTAVGRPAGAEPPHVEIGTRAFAISDDGSGPDGVHDPRPVLLDVQADMPVPQPSAAS